MKKNRQIRIAEIKKVDLFGAKYVTQLHIEFIHIQGEKWKFTSCYESEKSQ